MPALISMSISPGSLPAYARQLRAAASARRRAVGLRNPWLVSAQAASMRVPIAVHLAVDGKYGDTDLDAGGERQQHDTVSLMDPLLLEVLVQRHEQRGGRRVAEFLQVDDHVLGSGAKAPDEFPGARADGPGRGLMRDHVIDVGQVDSGFADRLG